MARNRHMERKSGWLYSGLISIAIFAIFSTMILLALPFGQYKEYNILLANKAIAATAVVMIGLSFFLGPLSRAIKGIALRLYMRKYLGVMGFGIAALHAILSVGLFDKAFYMDNQASFLLGALSFIIFAAVSVTSIPSVEQGMDKKQWKFVQRTGYLAFIFVLLHFSVLKIQYWMPYFTSLTGLPSSSLVAFIFGVIVIIARLSVIPFNSKKRK